ncbi:MAG: lipid-A-disaccharide synthase [Nitrospirales bacterium]|nr:lipid-A-disaccharide synthase [Nitrospirales bacterium]
MARIFLVSGEASGDLHGGKLARALKDLAPDIELFGVGGEHMVRAGVRLVPHINRVDAIGVPGVRQLLTGWKTLRALSAYIRTESFDAIVLIDSPGLNLRLAKSVNHLSDRMYYYIAPQLWAWGRRRMTLLRRVVKRVLAILPFEEPFFQKAGVPCTFVGHPLLDEIPITSNRSAERKALGVASDALVLGLLPGSRQREIREILPSLLESLKLIASRVGKLSILLAQAPNLPDLVIQEILQKSDFPVRVIKGHSNEVMAASDCLLIASGTATLQAALIGTPMVIVYRVSFLTYLIAKCLVTINFIGLVNIVAGREVVPELIQHRMTPQNISRAVLAILENPDRVESMKKELRAIRTSFGGPGASRRAAEVILADLSP